MSWGSFEDILDQQNVALNWKLTTFRILIDNYFFLTESEIEGSLVSSSTSSSSSSSTSSSEDSKASSVTLVSPLLHNGVCRRKNSNCRITRNQAAQRKQIGKIWVVFLWTANNTSVCVYIYLNKSKCN